MRLVRRPRPFDHPDWIFELKLDGFRALAHFENGHSQPFLVGYLQSIERASSETSNGPR
jgi:hypothetical protein